MPRNSSRPMSATNAANSGMSQRDLRHRVRTQLSWAGFGSPAPGAWVSPHVSRQAEGQRILDAAGVSGAAMSFVASYGQIGSQDMLVARAWDLGALEQRYADFIDEFTALDPASGEDVLRAQIRLVHEWRRFPFLDPRLPLRLLPETGTAPRPPTCSTAGTPTGIPRHSATGTS